VTDGAAAGGEEVFTMGAQRRIGVGLGLGLVAAMLAVPATRWVVVEQLRSLIWPRETDPFLQPMVPRLRDRADVAVMYRRLQRAAERAPEDFELQLDWALMDPAAGTRTEHLRALEARFPERASLAEHEGRYSAELVGESWPGLVAPARPAYPGQ